ncbi:MAG TPA: NAD(P)/FAD-dependent oxidoreductase [Steroidobacteraceae bacterium]|nr:NAD(P)/FAD-dependent oxidoreductase [Steroidobacteraceae bacterium]
MSREGVTIVGAGPAGALLAIILSRQGVPTTVYERRADPRRGAVAAGRSINLALAERGLHALRRAGLEERVRPLLIPMRGRIIHDLDGATTTLPYGQRPSEVIYSVSRAALNRLLIEAAIDDFGVDVHFDEACTGADLATATLSMRNAATGSTQSVACNRIIGADGSGSALRAAMVAAGATQAREEFLGHQYRELSIPPTAAGGHCIEREGLHIWPRGGFMLIALPNVDGSFTVTLFLARQGGADSFESLSTGEALQAFFRRHFADALALMPELVQDFFGNPAGNMGTVYAEPWSAGRTALLIGDAAHGIVPFHGQGMNCALEDCVVFDDLLAAGHEWSSVFAEFERQRRPNTDAIAEMALENYVEMRDTVRDPKFQLQKALSLELERRSPGRFVPRYSMVMFHHEIGYAEALERGRIQQALLDELTAGAARLADVDLNRAGELVGQRLAPLPAVAAS